MTNTYRLWGEEFVSLSAMMIVMVGRKGKWRHMRQQRRTNKQTNLVNKIGRERVKRGKVEEGEK